MNQTLTVLAQTSAAGKACRSRFVQALLPEANEGLDMMTRRRFPGRCGNVTGRVAQIPAAELIHLTGVGKYAISPTKPFEKIC